MYLPIYVHTSLPALHSVGHLAEFSPSQCNSPLDLRKEIPSLCHRLNKVHVSVNLFNGIPIYGDRGRCGTLIEHHLSLTQVHAEAYSTWFAGEMYVSQ